MKKIKRAINLFFLGLLIILSSILISCEPEVATYTVTFMNDGNVYQTVTVIAGQPVGEIEVPVAEVGKEFSFWSLDGNTQFNFNAPIDSNITLYAVWEDLIYDVTFFVNDIVYEFITVKYGEPISLPNSPSIEGKEFLYWSIDEINEYDSTTPVTRDITLYAIWEDLTYEIAFYIDDAVYETITVNYGDIISNLPNTPFLEGKEFKYWAIDGETEYDFTTPITGNLTLYAVWNDITHTVIFMDGNIELSRLTVTHGGIVDEPSTPVEEGKEFKWWSLPGTTNAYDFATPVTDDLTLYVIWKDNHTVIFKNGDTEISRVPITHGGTVTVPPVLPTEEGQVFKWWSIDKTDEFDFSTPVTSDIILYAVWEKLTYKVVFYVNDEIYKTITVNYGETVSDLPNSPSLEGKEFKCWSLDGTNEYEFTTPITSDLDVYAIFSDSKHNVTFVNGDCTSSSQIVEHNTPVEKPADPTSSDVKKRFYHWSLIENGEEAYDFSLPVTSDITLYAVWGEYRHNVSFVNGRWNSIVSVLNTDTVVPISDPEPSEEGDVFSHWSRTEYGEPFDFTTPIIEDITLYAVWKPVVTYVNGTEITKVIYEYGTTLTQPEDPKAVEDWQGDFFFWSEADRNKGETELFGSVIDKDVVLYAIWMPKGIYYSLNAENKLEITGHDYYTRDIYEEIVIPYGVEIIGDNAFIHCNKLASVFLPDSITRIGSQAFYNCIILENINIPDGVTEIASGAFSNCALKSITIPEGIKEIASSTFSSCGHLASIEIPDGVTKIGDNAFNGCSSLTNIELPDGVTSIGSAAFYDCSSLENLTLPESVTNLRYQTFYGCSSLKSIAIPNEMTEIESYTFYGCQSLTNIEIPDSVTIIGAYAFQGCYLIENITIPEGVREIARGAFCDSGLKCITIPEGVTEIAPSTFSGCGHLASIEIPYGVTEIGDNAFYGCGSLTNIELPDSIMSIGDRAFYNCITLESMEIPESATILGTSAFEKCSSLKSVVIPDGVTTIEGRTFYDCRLLESIEIPESVELIGDYTFTCCYALSKITIDNTKSAITRAPWGAPSTTEIIWLR